MHMETLREPLRKWGSRATARVIVPACAVLAVCGLWFAQNNIGWAMLAQDKGRSLQRLEVDEPHFENFRARRSHP